MKAALQAALSQRGIDNVTIHVYRALGHLIAVAWQDQGASVIEYAADATEWLEHLTTEAPDWQLPDRKDSLTYLPVASDNPEVGFACHQGRVAVALSGSLLDAPIAWSEIVALAKPLGLELPADPLHAPRIWKRSPLGVRTAYLCALTSAVYIEA